MDTYEFALKMEQDGEEFYRKIAAETSDKGLKTIANMLADQEQKHYKAILDMQKGDVGMEKSDLLHDAKNVFSQMRDDKIFNPERKQIEAYRKAQEIEKQSRDFYVECARGASNLTDKELYMRLAKEEETHYFLLDNIIELLSRPQQWLENAEWYHLDEY